MPDPNQMLEILRTFNTVLNALEAFGVALKKTNESLDCGWFPGIAWDDDSVEATGVKECLRNLRQIQVLGDRHGHIDAWASTLACNCYTENIWEWYPDINDESEYNLGWSVVCAWQRFCHAVEQLAVTLASEPFLGWLARANTSTRMLSELRGLFDNTVVLLTHYAPLRKHLLDIADLELRLERPHAPLHLEAQEPTAQEPTVQVDIAKVDETVDNSHCDVATVNEPQSETAGSPLLLAPSPVVAAPPPIYSAEFLPPAYEDPQLFARDRWICQQRNDGLTNVQILEALAVIAAEKNWNIITNPKSINDAIRRVAGPSAPKGKPGNPRWRNCANRAPAG